MNKLVAKILLRLHAVEQWQIVSHNSLFAFKLILIITRDIWFCVQRMLKLLDCAYI